MQIVAEFPLGVLEEIFGRDSLLMPDGNLINEMQVDSHDPFRRSRPRLYESSRRRPIVDMHLDAARM